jgi:Transcriptional Coactivator p15 (PC4)
MKTKVLQKSPTVVIKIDDVEFKGAKYVNIREYVVKGSDEIPTQKGLMVKHELFDEFCTKLNLARKQLDLKKEKSHD